MSCLHTVRIFAACTAVALGLSACSTTSFTGFGQLPDPLAGTGVVVVEAYGFKGNFHVDGDTTAYLSDENRHLVWSLPAGEHTLNDIYSTKAIDAGPGRYGSETTTLPLNRKFRVEAGKVTNLGLILIVANPKNKDQYHTYALDNTDAVRRYVRAAYPALAKTLKDSDFILAPGRYEPAARLAPFRRLIAFDKDLRNDKIVEPEARGDLVAGPAGLIGQYVVRGGRVEDVRIFDTGTLANAVSITRLGERYVIAMSDKSLFAFEHEKLTSMNPPPDAAPIIRAKLLYGGLVLVDAHLRAYMSSDEGRHWTAYAGGVIPAGQFIDAVAVGGGAGRTYFYYTDALEAQNGRMIYTDDSALAFKAVPAVEHICGNWDFVSTAAGAFFAPCTDSVWTEKPLVFFMPLGGSAWQTRPTPPGGWNCHFSGDASGTALNAACTTNNAPPAHYRSTDNAQTWHPVTLR